MKVDKVIARLAQMSRQGQSYEHMGRKGWSNPIRKDTGLLLEVLVATVNPKRILEIGTAHGESMCHLAKGAPKAELHTIEWLAEMAEEARINFKDAGLKVTVWNGDAMKIIPTFKEPFDLLFLDGNKDGYYEQMIELRQSGLLPMGSWVIADNVIDRKADCQDFLDYMSDNFRSVVLPTECGLLVGQI